MVILHKIHSQNCTIYTIYSQCAKWHHNCPDKSYKMRFRKSTYEER
ncbi:hypothetical protein CLOSTHATH_01811 [Hungatella hathewayi DSM 13479]|uniref:Uncharacterized protein n=1 Tax=Hungatella hathewayi DSM 13479 TaxID=566550 RepID=D3ADY2_9FIRM|nr:hypothetical protein CLOSTHATH_01811 [Hungatella hathewayi DSM 13479]